MFNSAICPTQIWTNMSLFTLNRWSKSRTQTCTCKLLLCAKSGCRAGKLRYDDCFHESAESCKMDSYTFDIIECVSMLRHYPKCVGSSLLRHDFRVLAQTDLTTLFTDVNCNKLVRLTLKIFKLIPNLLNVIPNIFQTNERNIFIQG